MENKKQNHKNRRTWIGKNKNDAKEHPVRNYKVDYLYNYNKNHAYIYNNVPHQNYKITPSYNMNVLLQNNKEDRERMERQ